MAELVAVSVLTGSLVARLIKFFGDTVRGSTITTSSLLLVGIVVSLMLGALANATHIA